MSVSQKLEQNSYFHVSTKKGYPYLLLMSMETGDNLFKREDRLLRLQSTHTKLRVTPNEYNGTYFFLAEALCGGSRGGTGARYHEVEG